MSKTLLLADDSVVIQKLVGLSFANEDVELVSTDNGDDAVIKAREIRPDVVLADVVMPGKSGYEVCEAIKQDPALAHVPVLLLTGTFEAFDEARAASVGADGHVTKPFEAQALVERVKNVIKNAPRPAARIADTASASSPAISAENLFDDDALIAPAPAPKRMIRRDDDLGTADDGFLGMGDSLDVTPSYSESAFSESALAGDPEPYSDSLSEPLSESLSESDLSESLDGDLFGAPGDIGGSSFSAALAPNPAIDRTPRLDDSPPVAHRSAAASIEDATVAMLPDADPDAETIVALADDSIADPSDDFDFDAPLDLAPLQTAAIDLDSAFDPEPVPAAKIQVAQDDASAMTARSLGRSAGVTDLDELLAAPPPPTSRVERRPEPPVALDFGPTERAGDLDFGFDVSEQAPVAKVDLLEESFSSLLDVSESQLLAEPVAISHAVPASSPSSLSAAPQPLAPATATATPPPIPTPKPIFTPPPIPTSIEPILPMPADPPHADATEFDVSSSDLATSGPRFEQPTPLAAAPSAAATMNTAAASALAGSDSARRAVDDLSPILQQRVHETLEKVAWEAFSDLSETIVKQVIARVEQIAWEVIPQMAETLVREEIRKLKGEGD